jgi:hypothetical protein
MQCCAWGVFGVSMSVVAIIQQLTLDRTVTVENHSSDVVSNDDEQQRHRAQCGEYDWPMQNVLSADYLPLLRGLGRWSLNRVVVVLDSKIVEREPRCRKGNECDDAGTKSDRYFPLQHCASRTTANRV